MTRRSVRNTSSVRSERRPIDYELAETQPLDLAELKELIESHDL